MTGLVLRLAVGSGRAAVGRLALVVMGTAVAAALLLVAVGIASLDRTDLAVTGASSFVTSSDGSVEVFDEPGSAGPISNEYLVQSELRRGVVIGFVLCVVPLVVFVAIASRVAARQREQRLAALRLAGASSAQVRALAALDTAVGATGGAVLGTLIFLVARAAVPALSVNAQLEDISERATPAAAAGAGVLVGLVVLSTATAALLLRRLQITPLGVVRRAPQRRPRPWGLLLLAVAVGGFFAVTTVGAPDTVAGDATLGALLVAVMIGLVTCLGWSTSLTGRALARWVRGPAALLAGRRLEDEPRGQARAMSAVVLVVLAATIALVALEDFRRNDVSGGDIAGDDFYVQGFALASLGIVFSLLVGSSALLLSTLEGLLERRRTMAALTANGVPVAVLRRAVLLQVSVPVLPAAVLAVGAALAVLSGLFSGEDTGLRVPWTVLLLPPAACAVTLLAAACTLPAVPRRVDLAQLRET